MNEGFALWRTSLLCLLLLTGSIPALAHESRPAYLEIKEGSAGLLEINWTRPIRAQRALNIQVVFPESCRTGGANTGRQLQGLMYEKWVMDCGATELSGKEVTIAGLSNTISDVLLRFQSRDGTVHMSVLDNKNPVFIFPSVTEPIKNIAPYYFKLGVEHILKGADHLLFILGLLLLIQRFWNVIKTITAFTLAHSISLIAAILGYVHVPSAPVEAVIALSIVFLACELVRENKHNLSRRLPWLVAAVFGLVHGLGFAGALSEIGLPEDDIPLALLMFNLGVETGQVLFVIFAIAVLQLLRRIIRDWFDKIELASSYAIGSIAAFWLFDRVSGFY